MKKLIIPIILLILASCSTDSSERTKKQIISYQNKIVSYTKKIDELEKSLPADSMLNKKHAGLVINVKEMQPELFVHTIKTGAKAEATEEAFVSPEINGQIKKIHVVDGQRVKKDQLLLSLNTDITEKSIKEVKTSLSLMQKLYEKQKELWDQNIGTEVQYLQAKTNKESTEARLATLEEQLDMAKIRASFNGIVEKIYVKKGELAMPGARLLHMVNLQKLKINADISENYLNAIKKGDKVKISFPATPDFKLDLPIKRIGSVIDNQSRTFQIELDMNNSNEAIRLNQLANLELQDFASDEAFVVPSIIVKQDLAGYYLYIVKETQNGPIASKRYVEPGMSARDLTMINSGLKSGMEVITAGYNLVKNGSSVKIINEQD